MLEKIIHTEAIMPDQPPEDDEGNREYKWKIVPQDPEDRAYRCTKLATQLNFRLGEGAGKAVYLLGVHDGGHAVGVDEMSLYTTLSMITEAAKRIKDTTIDKIRLYQGSCGKIATVRLSNPRLVEVF
jgi:GTPase